MWRRETLHGQCMEKSQTREGVILLKVYRNAMKIPVKPLNKK